MRLKPLFETVERKTIEDIFRKFEGRGKDEQVGILQLMIDWLRQTSKATDADFIRQFQGIKKVKTDKNAGEDLPTASPEDVTLMPTVPPQGDVSGLFATGPDGKSEPSKYPDRFHRRSQRPPPLPKMKKLFKRKKK